MNDAHGSPVLGRTRWRRFAVVAVPALALAGAIVFGMANGAIAASFAVSGSTFKVSADKLVGNGFVQYGGVAVDKAGNVHPVAVSGIKSASLTNLCQSVVVPGTSISLVIRAGKTKDATATDLLIDMTQLSGDATFNNISIGQDASTLTKGPAGAVGQAGGGGAGMGTHATASAPPAMPSSMPTKNPPRLSPISPATAVAAPIMP